MIALRQPSVVNRHRSTVQPARSQDSGRSRRATRRTMPRMSTTRSAPRRTWRGDYERVDAALAYLQQHRGRPVPLAEVAGAVELSPFHFQRLFTRWAGISPKRFQQYLTLDDARVLLRTEASLLQAACRLGLSGTGRLHDLFVTLEAVTPGEYKSGGAGLIIRIGVHETPFGRCLIGLTDRGVCWLSFIESGGSGAARESLRRAWPAARLTSGGDETGRVVERIFSPQGGSSPIRVLAGGTNFQIKVWEALLHIPPGRLATYGDVAAGIGLPRSTRAVGNAVGDNRVAFVIPCHRVIRSLGILGNYGGGVARKQAMIAWEAARYGDEL